MYWIAQVIGLLVVVAVFCATVLNQQRSWTTATTALGQSSSGVALLADMEKAKRRWTMRGYWWTVLVLLLLVAIGVVIGSLVASSRWKVPVVSASQPWIDTMVFSAAVWLIYLLLPGLAALILGPIALGRGVGLLAARRVAKAAGALEPSSTGVQLPAGALRVHWPTASVLGSTLVAALLAVAVGLSLVAALIVGAGLAISESDPSSKSV